MLVNKRNLSGNLNLLRFLFPGYEIIDENNIKEKPDKPAIYIGDKAKLEYFIKIYQELGINYIIYSHLSEIDLNNRRILCNIVFEKWRNATLPRYLDLIIDDINNDKFIEEVKFKWITGKWNIKEISGEGDFLNLIDKLNKSKFELFYTYFNNLLNNNSYTIESSVITFLIKAKQKSYTGNSFQYKKKLEAYQGKKLESTLKAIDKALEYNIDNKELRLLNILVNIQDSTKIG